MNIINSINQTSFKSYYEEERGALRTSKVFSKKVTRTYGLFTNSYILRAWCHHLFQKESSVHYSLPRLLSNPNNMLQEYLHIFNSKHDCYFSLFIPKMFYSPLCAMLLTYFDSSTAPFLEVDDLRIRLHVDTRRLHSV